MEFTTVNYFLAFLAGVLSTLSPCVLPILPIVLSIAFNQHRLGPLALATGLTVSFAIIGTLLSQLGASIGLDQESFRVFAAILMIVIAMVLLSERLQAIFASLTSGLSSFGHGLLSRVTLDGLTGQFLIGILLGLVWSPCVGPTLGAAVTLASQGKELGNVIFIMLIFGLGAGLPLVLIGYASKKAVGHLKGKLGNIGKIGKKLLGLFFLIMGVLIISGSDKNLEAFLLQHSPSWLTTLTTSF